MSGCLLVAAGAVAGAGAYTYYQGNVSSTYAAEFGETYQSVKKALNDLAMPIREERHEGLSGAIESSIEDGTHVTIKLEEKPRMQANDGHQTEVTVRVGVLGDSKLSTRLHQQIGAHITQRASPGNGTRLPAIGATATGQPVQQTSSTGQPATATPAGSSGWKPASQSTAGTVPP